MKAWEEVAERLTFPIGGKEYVAHEVGYQDGLRLQQIESKEIEVSADDQWRLLIGPAYDEMLADNAPQNAILRACLSALTEYRTGSRELAEQVWESGVTLPNLTAVPEAAPETDSSSTDEAIATPSPASSTGTTSRPARSKRKPPSSSPS